MAESIDINLNNGTMWLRVSCGEVVSQQKWSETSVSSYGGSVSADGRQISAPSVSSVVSQNHEFWVREPDGQERVIKLLNRSFQVREGHKIWIAWGNKKGEATGPFLLGHNLATGETAELVDNWTTWMYGAELIKKPLLYRFFTKLVPAFLGASSVYVLMIGGGSGADFIFLPLAVWGIFWCLANFIGYYGFLRRRDESLVKSIKKRILDACIEAANKANVTS